MSMLALIVLTSISTAVSMAVLVGGILGLRYYINKRDTEASWRELTRLINSQAAGPLTRKEFAAILWWMVQHRDFITYPPLRKKLRRLVCGDCD